MLAWNELLTDWAWHEILHRHFRPSQSRKWITARWLTHGKQLQEVALWRKLKKTTPRDPFKYILNLEASLYSLLSFEWTLTRLKNSLRQNIVFSYSEKIPVSFSFFLSFFLCFFIFRFFLLFHVIINFYKNYLLLLFYYIFFHENYFYFFHVPGCSGMFRNVPACSGMFHVPDFIDGPGFLVVRLKIRE